MLCAFWNNVKTHGLQGVKDRVKCSFLECCYDSSIHGRRLKYVDFGIVLENNTDANDGFIIDPL